MDSKTMIERLKWLANAGYGNEMPDWLGPNVWGKSISELATAALETITAQEEAIERLHDVRGVASIDRDRFDELVGRLIDSQHYQSTTTPWGIRNILAVAGYVAVPAWRPIAEAPIPPPSEAPDGFIFNCMLQNAGGVVGEGCARYVSDGRVRGSRHVRILRWYFGDGTRESRVCAGPRYFMPLPQPRKD